MRKAKERRQKIIYYFIYLFIIIIILPLVRGRILEKKKYSGEVRNY